METTRLLMERDERHQAMVRILAELASLAQVYEFPFDLLIEPDAEELPLLLWEVKTVDSDAAAQVRAALGQLIYYEYFEVRPNWSREVIKAAAFDKPIGTQLAELLEFVGIAAFQVETGELLPLNSLAERTQQEYLPRI